MQLLYRILFLYHYFYYVTITTTQDGGGGIYVYASSSSSSSSTFDHDDSNEMSNNSSLYHPTTTTGISKLAALERNVEVVSRINNGSSYNNSKCLTAEPFVLGSTIEVFPAYATVDSILTNSVVETCASFTFPNYLRGVWYNLTGTGKRHVVEACDAYVVVLSGDCTLLECVASAQSPCVGNPLLFETVQGKQYLILVSLLSYENSVLKISEVAQQRTPISPCDIAIPYPLGLRINVDTRNANESDPYYYERCYVLSIYGPGVWYKIKGTGRNITARALLKPYRTGFGIYSGTCDSNYEGLRCIAACKLGNVFRCIVEFHSVRGRTYYINVVTEEREVTPILIRSKCGLLGLQSIFCPLQFNGIIGRIFRRIFYEFGKLIGKN